MINFKASVCFVVFGEAEFRKLPLHHSQLGQIWEKDPPPPPLEQLGASQLKSKAEAPTKSLKLLRVKFGKEPLSVQLTPLYFYKIISLLSLNKLKLTFPQSIQLRNH